jgi:class 3 adenylate cyclase
MIETLETGRDAIARHAWAEAIEAFRAADRDSGLEPNDLGLLGEALWWAGRPDDSAEALERAFASYSEAGSALDAAEVALALAHQGLQRGAMSIAVGWLARAEHLLESQPESRVHAVFLAYRAFGELIATHLSEAIEIADRAMEVARRHGSADALFASMTFKGMASVASGDWRAGLPLIDEAATAAASGQLSLLTASEIFCDTMSTCRSIGDLERAGQWADEAERWMRRQSVGGYPGVCRVHRAELKMLRGQWSEAEQEARQACDELERYRMMIGVGYAHYFIGEVRLRMGDLVAAGEALERAYEYGHDAQPGLALLQLAQGEVDEAQRSIGRALATAAGSGGRADRATRGRLLPAQVNIAIAAGDLVIARQAVDELDTIAAEYERPLFEAGALTARGELLLGEDKPAEASPLLGRSWRIWQATDLPYEAARARLHFAEAVAAEGDAIAARRDMRAARAAFERLGASLDLQRVDALLGEDRGTASQPTKRATRTFMFTDIVTSTDLIGLIGDEAWAELLRWHDRELRSAIAEHRGEEIRHTGDGLFVAFERAGDGVECAIDIQRRLWRHRKDHGFAPRVRIGLHTAEATREGGSYLGRGVHVAARIGAAAAGDEILASGPVTEGSGASGHQLSEPRSLMLKGVGEPVDVRAIDWR